MEEDSEQTLSEIVKSMRASSKKGKKIATPSPSKEDSPSQKNDDESGEEESEEKSPEEEEKAWLTSYRTIIEDEELIAEIDRCISSSYDSFSEIAEAINKTFNIADNDSISNLVLLDSSTNRGYKNSCFSEKRKKIIEIERTKNNDEKYIPIGTKWVFLKGYDNATQLKAWALSDMKDYVEDISLKIYKMLGGIIDG